MSTPIPTARPLLTVAQDAETTRALAILWKTIAIVISLSILFVLFYACVDTYLFKDISKDLNGGDHEFHPNKTQDPEKLGSFSASNSYFMDVHHLLSSIDLANSWTGRSGERYTGQHAQFREQLTQVMEANTQADTTLRIEDQQVNDARRTLNNLLQGLVAAIPVAESLYSCGPAGPILSQNFQLAVATPAAGSATETTHHMQTNSAEHAKTLDALAQQYGEVFDAVFSRNFTESLSQESSANLVADQDCLTTLAPHHQHAADTFATATHTVRGTAENISTAHGAVCNASNNALRNVEEAHNTLTSALQEYCANLAAALPAAANAYETADQLATKHLESQLR